MAKGRIISKAPAGFVFALAFAGCTLIGGTGDRLLAERDFAGARDAYLDVLENHQSGRRVERALYHLSLIYLQSDFELHDPAAAEAALTRLTYIRPRSRYAAKATLLLALQRGKTALEEAVEAQQELSREAERKLASLREEADQTEAESEDQSKRVGLLGNRILGLQAQIVKLREELAATGVELSEREQELERLKKIDLEDPG